jgi:hypothetical protein
MSAFGTYWKSRPVIGAKRTVVRTQAGIRRTAGHLVTHGLCLAAIVVTTISYEKVMFSCVGQVVNVMAITYPSGERDHLRSGGRADGRHVQTGTLKRYGVQF